MSADIIKILHTYTEIEFENVYHAGIDAIGRIPFESISERIPVRSDLIELFVGCEFAVAGGPSDRLAIVDDLSADDGLGHRAVEPLAVERCRRAL